LVAFSQGLFPPWKLVFTGGDWSPGDWSEGFAFLLNPPSPSPNAYQYHAALQIYVDWTRLMVEWVITFLVIAVSCWLFVRRPDESNSGLLKMLESRKLLSSLIVGLGLPVPFVGIAAILGLIGFLFPPLVTIHASPLYFLADYGHDSFFVESVVAFVVLTGLSLLFFLVLQVVRSSRAKSIVAVLAAILFFATGILGPVILSAQNHRRRERISKNHVTAVDTLHDLNRSLGVYRTKYGKHPSTLDRLGPVIVSNSGYKGGCRPRGLHG